jgi:hypothetical protein
MKKSFNRENIDVDRLYNIIEAADLLGYNLNYFYQLIRKGNIEIIVPKHNKNGRKYISGAYLANYFSKEELNDV